jgi:hypothetical protein
MQLVGITGLKGSGKTLVAQCFAEEGFIKVPLAYPLKKMLEKLAEVRGVPSAEIYEALYGQDKEKPVWWLEGKPPRHAMQTLGTEWGRYCIRPRLWINAWFDEASKHEYVVTDDVRFPNEADFVRKLGGKLIRVSRPTITNGYSDSHPSESGILDLPFDIEIVNSGTRERVRVIARQFAKELKDAS